MRLFCSNSHEDFKEFPMAWEEAWGRILNEKSIIENYRFNVVQTVWMGVHWKDWCWSWSSSTLATSWKELTHLKRPWCWEGLGAGGEGDDRGWDGWMTSLTRCTWVWVDSGSWWWTGRPGVLRFMASQRVGHDWTELNWTEVTIHHCSDKAVPDGAVRTIWDQEKTVISQIRKRRSAQKQWCSLP